MNYASLREGSKLVGHHPGEAEDKPDLTPVVAEIVLRDQTNFT